MVYFLGSRPYDFTDDSGKKVTGITAWFCEDGQTNAVGWTPFKASYSVEKFREIFGTDKQVLEMSFQPVQLEYNRYGKPENVTLLEDEGE